MSLSITGKRSVKMSPWSIWLLLDIYMCPCTIWERKSRSSEWIPFDWNRSIRFRIRFCIEWYYFQSRENDGWKCQLDCLSTVGHIYVSMYDIGKGIPLFRMNSRRFVIGLFDSEFDSASNDVTFNHGKTIGENVTSIESTTVGHIYVSMYDIRKRIPVFRMNSRRLK